MGSYEPIPVGAFDGSINGAIPIDSYEWDRLMVSMERVDGAIKCSTSIDSYDGVHAFVGSIDGVHACVGV